MVKMINKTQKHHSRIMPLKILVCKDNWNPLIITLINNPLKRDLKNDVYNKQQKIATNPWMP